jgi:hypothetical protein
VFGDSSRVPLRAAHLKVDFGLMKNLVRISLRRNVSDAGSDSGLDVSDEHRRQIR